MCRGRAGPDGVMFFEDMARRAVGQVPKPENNITPHVTCPPYNI